MRHASRIRGTCYSRQKLLNRSAFALKIIIFSPENAILVFSLEGMLMPKSNLASMTIEQLLQLRTDLEKVLSRKANELQSQLVKLGGEIKPTRMGRGTSLRGRKIAPKYRSPEGEIWAGRGMKPRWLTEAMKQGKKIEDFLIEKTARKRRKK
jgi:DNA-binding protein H-NS